MSPESVLGALKSLCRDIDAGRSLRRISLTQLVLPLAVPAAMGLAVTAGGCAGHTAVTETDCSDGVDNDEDGDFDCRDSDCFDHEDCEEDCTDGIDNDSDGLLDCEDDECADHPFCDGVLYGGPFG